MSKVTLKPGDYVRTEGMTEDQYHAVAEIMAKAYGGKPFLGASRRKFLFIDQDGDCDGVCNIIGRATRELTVAQILGTEQNQDGWTEWNGGECPVPEGTLVDVRYRDGAVDFASIAVDPGFWSDSGHQSYNWSHKNHPGDIIAYRLHQPEESPMTIEQLLAKANHHAAKAAKHERKRDELIEQARELVPEGWELKECEPVKHPEEDMTNPENWKAGDVVECVTASFVVEGREAFKMGKKYTVAQDYKGGRFLEIVTDENGEANAMSAKSFRWLRRPSAQD